MTRVVMFSGGVGSWMTARRVADGTNNLVLLFADTRVEEADLYRFLDEAAANVGGQLVKVADGRTPFEVFFDDRFLGNARLANCSKFLKQRPCRRWLEENCDPAETTVYVGIDWSETHRMPAIEAGWAPYRVEAPLTLPPLLDKMQMLDDLRAQGLTPPRSYVEGFPHANCMAQGCGHAYWRKLLLLRPNVYAATEREEERIRETDWGRDAAILRDRSGGESVPITLREFRERVAGDPSLFDADEWGGCGCFVDEGRP